MVTVASVASETDAATHIATVASSQIALRVQIASNPWV
jgi:hypothetical protein